jgi:hypothetical protein
MEQGKYEVLSSIPSTAKKRKKEKIKKREKMREICFSK